MSNAGRIGGIQDISQGIGLDLKPYVVGAAANAPGRGLPETTGDLNVGLDIFYNLTPALKSNFTINTDFAETEVDERRTNLTRFPLFFPEKREFFLDGANFFEFPGGDESPFFSRRIGLNQGEVQPIIYGAKLIGQAGRQDIGFLQVRTGEGELVLGDQVGTLSGEDFTVARVKHRFGSQSHVGGLYTRRADRDAILDPRHTIGADVTLATPDFIGGSTFDSGAWYVHTTKPGLAAADGDSPLEGGSDAFGADVSVDRDPYSAEVRFKEVQDVYDPAVGFTPRRGYREWSPEANWSPRLEGHPLVRGFDFGAELELNTNLRNQLIDRNIQLTPLNIEFHSGDSVEFQLFRQDEHLDVDFEISDGIILPEGSRYDWLRYQVVYDGAEQRAISGRVEYSWGGFWDGSREELNLDLNLRPRPGLFFALSSEQNFVTLPGGSFTEFVYRFDARTQLSPWTSLSNNIQYDTESGEIGWQLRFRWIQKPGDDLYFIWTQNWFEEDEIGGFTTLDRRGAAKVVRTIRF
jgi:hypothetical protein